MTRDQWRQECNEYLAKRVGTYDFRCRRYDIVIERLNEMGVAEHDVVYDLGAGMAEFGRRLYDREFYLRYVPVDGCIDGTDLNDWRDDPDLIPPADVFVAIEVMEHLRDPRDHASAHATRVSWQWSVKSFRASTSKPTERSISPVSARADDAAA